VPDDVLSQRGQPRDPVSEVPRCRDRPGGGGAGGTIARPERMVWRASIRSSTAIPPKGDARTGKAGTGSLAGARNEGPLPHPKYVKTARRRSIGGSTCIHHQGRHDVAPDAVDARGSGDGSARTGLAHDAPGAVAGYARAGESGRPVALSAGGWGRGHRGFVEVDASCCRASTSSGPPTRCSRRAPHEAILVLAVPGTLIRPRRGRPRRVRSSGLGGLGMTALGPEERDRRAEGVPSRAGGQGDRGARGHEGAD